MRARSLLVGIAIMLTVSVEGFAQQQQLRRRHPTDRVHHGAGADPENPHASWRTA